MKILDKYLLKSFLITFTTVFVILFFIFVLQVVWLYISELAGKDLNFLLVLKFLAFKMPSVVPMVLPLSVLLASIMTYGNLSENYEFAAMKSAGISLQRAMKVLTAFIVLLSIVSFFFANNVIPYAEYKFVNFRRNIAQLSPAMAITEGQLSEVGNYNIKVDKKSGEKGNLLTGVTIHKKLDNGEGSTTVIKAKSGELISSENSNVLKLVLHNGYYYEDIIPQKYDDRQKVPFAKATFKKDIIYMDLTKLNKDPNAQQGEITNTSNMLTFGQLKYTIDSLNTNFKKDIASYSENIYQRAGVNTLFKNNSKPNSFDYSNILNAVPVVQKTEVLRIAKTNVENVEFSIDASVLDFNNKQKNINGHWIAIHEKFMIAFSCLLMFFIGAPLGAIIRKGGMGLPIVFAVVIFIMFHFINSFGKRLAQENGITPFLGVWLSTLVLIPLAIYFTKTAINDIGGIVTADQIGDFIKRILGLQSYVEKTPVMVDITNYKFNKDKDWDTLSNLSDELLIKTVKQTNRYNYSEDYRAKALVLLNDRGITQQDLLKSNQLFDREFDEINFHSNHFMLLNKYTLAFSILIIILCNAMINKINAITIIGLVLSIILYYLFLILTINELKKLEKLTNEKIIGIGFIFSLIFNGLFFVFFLIFKKKVNQILEHYTK